MAANMGCCAPLSLRHHHHPTTPPTGQAGVIRPLSARVGEAAAVRAGVGFLTLAFLGLGLSTRLWQLLLCLIPLAFSTVIVSTLNTARLSRVGWLCGGT